MIIMITVIIVIGIDFSACRTPLPLFCVGFHMPGACFNAQHTNQEDTAVA